MPGTFGGGAWPLWGGVGWVGSGQEALGLRPPPSAPRAGACPPAGRGLEGAGWGRRHDSVPTEEDSRELGLQVEVCIW